MITKDDITNPMTYIELALSAHESEDTDAELRNLYLHWKDINLIETSKVADELDFYMETYANDSYNKKEYESDTQYLENKIYTLIQTLRAKEEKKDG